MRKSGIAILAAICLLFSGTVLSEAESIKNNTVLLTNDAIRAGFEYGDKYMLLTFKKCGVNSVISLSGINMKDRDGTTTLMNSMTDWVGPYVVKALNYGGEGASIFTGGWHGSGGNGNGAPTAKTVLTEVYADGRKVDRDKLQYCSEISICVVNLVQGYNTVTLKGTGEFVLKETVLYTIAGNTINIGTEINALEDIAIEKYYGLQTQNSAWRDSVEYGRFDREYGYTCNGSGGIGYSRSEIPAQKIILRSRHHMLTAWLDTDKGLGTRQYLAKDKPYAFTETYGKSYFNLINGITAKMKKGDILFWSGGYRFDPVVD